MLGLLHLMLHWVQMWQCLPFNHSRLLQHGIGQSCYEEGCWYCCCSIISGIGAAHSPFINAFNKASMSTSSTIFVGAAIGTCHQQWYLPHSLLIHPFYTENFHTSLLYPIKSHDYNLDVGAIFSTEDHHWKWQQWDHSWWHGMPSWLQMSNAIPIPETPQDTKAICQ